MLFTGEPECVVLIVKKEGFRMMGSRQGQIPAFALSLCLNTKFEMVEVVRMIRESLG